MEGSIDWLEISMGRCICLEALFSLDSADGTNIIAGIYSTRENNFSKKERCKKHPEDGEGEVAKIYLHLRMLFQTNMQQKCFK